MRHDAMQLVPGSISTDQRRARASCDACGITVDRIHPLKPIVEQVEHVTTSPPRRT